MERRAQDAERNERKLKKVEYMQQVKLGEAFTGVHFGGSNFLGILWNLIIRSKEWFRLTACDDFYVFDEESYKLTENIPDEFSHWVKR